jgi:hypothetical protein
MDERLLYDRREAARQLSISVRSVDYAIANKELDTRRHGRRVLITHASLVRYASSNHYQVVKKTARKASHDAFTSRSEADAVASGDKCA